MLRYNIENDENKIIQIITMLGWRWCHTSSPGQHGEQTEPGHDTDGQRRRWVCDRQEQEDSTVLCSGEGLHQDSADPSRV